MRVKKIVLSFRAEEKSFVNEKKIKIFPSFSFALNSPPYSIVVITLTKVEALAEWFVVPFLDSFLNYLNFPLPLIYTALVLWRNWLKS